MFAVVTIAGQQFKVEEGQKVFVHRLDAEEGDQVTFEDVLLVSNGSGVNIGTPTLSGASVSAKVLKHLKGDKVIVFKKKRRKGYRRKNGHRQYLTQIEINSIGAGNGKSERKEPKKAEVKTSKSSDDLTKIEGLGPKAKELLNNAGITSFAQLASKSGEEIKEILVAGSNRMNMIQPDTWPKQAQLAADGKWDELKAWQDELDGGK